MSGLLTGLNPEQHAAVVHKGGPLLVLAGAGSGKTRVITRRIARLVAEGEKPWGILAVTFTNKAAGEMLERVRVLAGDAARDVWISTFHAAGVRLLRRDGHKIGLPRNFTILDETDQLAQMKRVCADLQLPEGLLTPKDALARIDQWKNVGLAPAEVEPSDDVAEAAARAYARYEDALKAQGAVDFGDLLLRVVELFRASPETRDFYRRRFRHVLVDEFQDTNPVQYELLRQLCPDDRSKADLCVVGDDDQAIYRWRGAEVRHILQFPRDFPGATVVKLERNYRSTPRILEAAHAVISKNRERAPKKLWTEGEPGDPLELDLAWSDRDEAARIAERLAFERARGTHLDEMAVFYRSNAQSRILEEALRQRTIPYTVVRGQSFYERAEIRDVAAWLRLLVNPKSDGDFLRAVQAPPRGVGDTTLEKLAAYATANGRSLWEASGVLDFVPGLNAGARQKLAAFRSLVERLQAGAGGKAADVAEAVAEQSGLLERLLADPRGEGADRRDNVREFIQAARDFDAAWAFVAGEAEGAPPTAVARPDAALAPVGTAQLAALRALRGDGDQPAPTPLEAFLAQLAVLGDADTEAGEKRVSLMTFHAAKGLEFDVVFLTGLEENVFPPTRSIDDEDALSEERRLCYVGLTRARKRIFLSLARSRALYGELKQNRPSRFLAELPAAHVKGLGQLAPPAPPPAPRWSTPAAERPRGEYVERELEDRSWDDDAPRRPPPRLTPVRPATPAVRASRRVRHAKFGDGRVLATLGTGPDAKLTVDFPGVGPKVVVARFLVPLD